MKITKLAARHFSGQACVAKIMSAVAIGLLESMHFYVGKK